MIPARQCPFWGAQRFLEHKSGRSWIRIADRSWVTPPIDLNWFPYRVDPSVISKPAREIRTPPCLGIKPPNSSNFTLRPGGFESGTEREVSARRSDMKHISLKPIQGNPSLE